MVHYPTFHSDNQLTNYSMDNSREIHKTLLFPRAWTTNPAQRWYFIGRLAHCCYRPLQFLGHLFQRSSIYPMAIYTP